MKRVCRHRGQRLLDLGTKRGSQVLRPLWLRPPEELLGFLDQWIQDHPMTSQKLVLVCQSYSHHFATENGKLKGQPSSGGLVSAVKPLLKDHGGIWVGSGGTKTLRRSARSWRRRVGIILISMRRSF